MCSECDAGLAARIAALPPEYRTELLRIVSKLVQTYASFAGVDLPDTPLPANVVQLRRHS